MNSSSPIDSVNNPLPTFLNNNDEFPSSKNISKVSRASRAERARQEKEKQEEELTDFRTIILKSEANIQKADAETKEKLELLMDILSEELKYRSFTPDEKTIIMPLLQNITIQQLKDLKNQKKEAASNEISEKQNILETEAVKTKTTLTKKVQEEVQQTLKRDLNSKELTLLSDVAKLLGSVDQKQSDKIFLKNVLYHPNPNDNPDTRIVSKQNPSSNTQNTIISSLNILNNQESHSSSNHSRYSSDKDIELNVLSNSDKKDNLVIKGKNSSNYPDYLASLVPSKKGIDLPEVDNETPPVENEIDIKRNEILSNAAELIYKKMKSGKDQSNFNLSNQIDMYGVAEEESFSIAERAEITKKIGELKNKRNTKKEVVISQNNKDESMIELVVEDKEKLDIDEAQLFILKQKEWQERNIDYRKKIQEIINRKALPVDVLTAHDYTVLEIAIDILNEGDEYHRGRIVDQANGLTSVVNQNAQLGEERWKIIKIAMVVNFVIHAVMLAFVASVLKYDR